MSHQCIISYGSFIGAYFTLFLLLKCSDAFAPTCISPRGTTISLLATKEPLQLTTNLTPSQIANLARTPSHSESKSGTWSEAISADETFTRYIVEGEGSITLTSSNGEASRRRINPGSLVEIKGDEGESQLIWDVDDEMMILYSGEVFDEQQKVVIGLFGLFLVAGGLTYLGMGL